MASFTQLHNSSCDKLFLFPLLPPQHVEVSEVTATLFEAKKRQSMAAAVESKWLVDCLQWKVRDEAFDALRCIAASNAPRIVW